MEDLDYLYIRVGGFIYDDEEHRVEGQRGT